MDTPPTERIAEDLSRITAAFAFFSADKIERAAERLNFLHADTDFARRGDALIVASANAGVAALILDDAPAAHDWLVRAAAAIHDTSRALDGDGALRATSSGYHFRLAVNHGDVFEKANAARANELRALMSAVVAHHHALLDGDAIAQRDQMRAAIDQMFGTSSIEARLSRAESPSDFMDCYAERADKLRVILRHWPARARLSPEIAIAALAILPFDPRRLPAGISAGNAIARGAL